MSEQYTFRREFVDEYGQKKTVEHTVEAVTLPEVLEGVLYFLNGCSYSYVKDLVYVCTDGSERSVIDERDH